MAGKIGDFFVPAVLTIVGLLLLFTKKDLFSEFLEGANEGLKTCLKLIPMFVILMTAVGMFSKSGAMTYICEMLSGILNKIGFPSALAPLMIMRPLSGSAATAMINNLFASQGPDSFAGRCASIIMGASDTIIYTLALYFGAVGITKTRHAYPASFITLIFCAALSTFLTYIFF